MSHGLRPCSWSASAASGAMRARAACSRWRRCSVVSSTRSTSARCSHRELAVLDHLESSGGARFARCARPTSVRFEFAHALVQHTLYENIGRTRRGAPSARPRWRWRSSAACRSPAAAMAHHWMSTGRDDRRTWPLGAPCRLGGDGSPRPRGCGRLVPAGAHARRSTTTTDSRVMIDLGAAQRWADSVVFRGTLARRRVAGRATRRRRRATCVLRSPIIAVAPAVRARSTRSAWPCWRALEFVGDGDSAGRALLLATMAQEDSQGSDIERSIALADEALGVARRVGDDVTLFQVLLRITEATRIPATLERRLAATKELFDIAERLGDPVQLGFAAVAKVRTKYEAAQFDEVESGVPCDRCVQSPRPVRAPQPSLSSAPCVAQLHRRPAGRRCSSPSGRGLGGLRSPMRLRSTSPPRRWFAGTWAPSTRCCP